MRTASRATLCLLTVFALSVMSPARGQIDPQRLARIDAAVSAAVAKGNPPGAVVLVLHRGEVVYHKAFGLRSKAPAEAVMTTDTVFDLASVTKPVATATSVMLLIEQGKLRPSDRVVEHWPEFTGNGKERITVGQLLLHTSGLIADNPIADYEDGKEQALRRICGLKPVAAPGERFIYSDVGYIVLGVLVERLSGRPLDAFA